MQTRFVAALVVAAVFAGTAPMAWAQSPVLHPSARALAAADEPPPSRDEAPAVKQATTTDIPEEPKPLYKTWWFWALTAAVVGGTIIFGVATFKPAENLPRACPLGAVACFGDGRLQ